MMRPGDKLDSYRLLARALERLADLPWTLSIIGDGPCRAEVMAEFSDISAKRIDWLGQIEPAAVQPVLSGADIYVWPGCGEAFGLAYLEAQAAGLPVVAQNTAGVPEVVIAGRTGLLTPPNDSAAFADAIRFLLTHASRRRSMGEAAETFCGGRTIARRGGRSPERHSRERRDMTALEPAWQPLADELARWNGAGRAARFWLRDDDAVEPTDALDRLLGLSGAFAVPVTLAVIPALTGDALADRLRTEPHASVAVHGWSHRNHAPEGQKKQELGAHRPRATVLDELARGLPRLARLHGARAVPMLVPPWNRIDAGLIPDLVPLGFEVLSVYGPPRPAPIRMFNSNVDLLDWRGSRGCRDHAELVHDIVAQLGTGFR